MSTTPSGVQWSAIATASRAAIALEVARARVLYDLALRYLALGGASAPAGLNVDRLWSSEPYGRGTLPTPAADPPNSQVRSEPSTTRRPPRAALAGRAHDPAAHDHAVGQVGHPRRLLAPWRCRSPPPPGRRCAARTRSDGLRRGPPAAALALAGGAGERHGVDEPARVRPDRAAPAPPWWSGPRAAPARARPRRRRRAARRPRRAGGRARSARRRPRSRPAGRSASAPRCRTTFA